MDFPSTNDRDGKALWATSYVGFVAKPLVPMMDHFVSMYKQPFCTSVTLTFRAAKKLKVIAPAKKNIYVSLSKKKKKVYGILC